MNVNVGIYIYDGAEVLDFSGPFEVFTTASRLSDPKDLFRVFLVAERNAPVGARGGFVVNPHHGFGEHPPIDVLIVVGGVHAGELEKPAVTAWIGETARDAGLLAGLDATTHWEDLDDLAASYPDLNVIRDRRWVDTGAVVTSGGISAGIDMSLHLVARLADRDLAKKTARKMEYEWQQND